MNISIIRKIFNRLRFSSTKSGKYRFFVRNWRGINDINILSQVLATETWRATLRPRSLSLGDFNKIVVLAPHQDDELIGAGGLLLKAREMGIKTVVVFLTNGAQTGLKIGDRQISSTDTVDLRKQEAVAVCKQLQSVYEEIGIDNISMDVSPNHVERLRDLLVKHSPDLVLLPWLFDGSPKHRVANQLLFHAIGAGTQSVKEVWGYQVNNSPFANGYLETTSYIDEKLTLLEIYESQNRGIRSYENLARGLSAWNSRFLPSKSNDGKATYAEIFFTVPTNDFCKLIQDHYFQHFEQTFLGKSSIAKTMHELYRHYRRQ